MISVNYKLTHNRVLFNGNLNTENKKKNSFLAHIMEGVGGLFMNE